MFEDHVANKGVPDLFVALESVAYFVPHPPAAEVFADLLEIVDELFQVGIFCEMDDLCAEEGEHFAG